MAALRHAPIARAAQFRALAVSCGVGSPEAAAKAATAPPVSQKMAPGVLIGMSESDLQQLALEFGQVRFELEAHNLILVDELTVVLIMWQDKYRGKQLHQLLYKRKIREIQDLSQGEGPLLVSIYFILCCLLLIGF